MGQDYSQKTWFSYLPCQKSLLKFITECSDLSTVQYNLTKLTGFVKVII